MQMSNTMRSRNRIGKKLPLTAFLKKKYSRFIPLYIMMLPGLAYLIINNYIPMSGIVIAFKQINYQLGIWRSPWVGLANFEFLFRTNDAWLITRNTLLYNLTFLIIDPLIAITVAILLNELKGKRRKQTYQTVILIPHLISMVVVSYLVYALLTTENGFINNSILGALGFDKISWYSSPQYWPFILIFVHAWKGFGYSSIIYYSTVVGISPEYYEAAAIDGASRWQQILNITLPGLRTTIITLTILSVGRIFNSDFGLFYQIPMNSGALYNVTSTIDTYVYRGLMELNNVGMTSAAGLYQSAVGFILVLITNYVVGRISEDAALF